MTLKSALEEDDNVLHKLAYPEQRVDFYVDLYGHRSDIEAIVSYYLGLNLSHWRSQGMACWELRRLHTDMYRPNTRVSE